MSVPPRPARSKHSFLKLGAPLMIVVVGGAYMLSHVIMNLPFSYAHRRVNIFLKLQFLSARNEIRNRREVFGSISTREFDLAEEHAKMMKSLDIDSYKLSKIPNRENLKNLPELKDRYDDE